jgi:polyhydroxyalkanoate synthesis regulator phasin
MILTFLLAAVFTSVTSLDSYASTSQLASSQPINGVVMKGAFVNMKQDDNGSPEAPQDYIEDSLKMISGAGLDHARFLFYWEAYERDPEAFIKEIQSVAKAADKYGVKIIYDNHQWHTSSWLEDRGTGFPWSLFEGEYSRGGGGNTPDKAAQVFWADWWDRSVKDEQGKDGWTLMAQFLKKIVLAVDNHSSTLGYEILSEPHVDNIDQWSKIGKFNSFITAELRNITSKTIIYSMNVPVDLNSPIKISPENLAKMAPSHKENIAFKISVYGVPDRDQYQKERFDTFLKTRNLTGVPLYIGEWNNVVRTKEGGVFKINPGASDFTKTNAGQILEAFKKAGVWGTAFWKWDFRDADTASFNLVSDNNGELKSTKYFGILEDTVETIYGSSGLAENSNESTATDTAPANATDTAPANATDTAPANATDTAPATATDTASANDDAKQYNLINELMKTGKFTEAEAKQIVSKTMQNGTEHTSTSTTSSSDDVPTIANTDTSSGELRSSNNEDNNNINNNQSSNTITNNPEEYNDLNELVDDIKNSVVDTNEISLNAFKDSGAYQGADQNTKDCIDLAGKIGGNLIDYEIVRCSEDTNFFLDQIASSDDNNDNNNNNADDTGN